MYYALVTGERRKTLHATGNHKSLAIVITFTPTTHLLPDGDPTFPNDIFFSRRGTLTRSTQQNLTVKDLTYDV